MRKNPSLFASAAALAALTLVSPAARAADFLLSGTVASADGEKMGGVTVTAVRAAGRL